MERADIKLAIDMLAGMNEEARIAAHCIGTLEDCGNEIAQLRADLAAAQAENQHLRMALADTEALELGTAERLAAAQQRISEVALEALSAQSQAMEHWDRVGELKKELAAAQQRIAELEKDAARYRFIRQHETWEAPRGCLPKWHGGNVKWIGGTYSFDEIDAIIDAALEQKEIEE